MIKGKELIALAKSTQKDHQKIFHHLQKFSSHDVNELFHTAHEQVFQEINCLDCGNCCSTTPALISEPDAKRIAKHLKISVSSFYSTYISKDDDGDQVFKKSPCVFLGADNFCSIYEVRPSACREYPHTDHPKMKQILNITFKNREICPAVYDIVEGLKASLD
ncbi:MAG TPA: YkgJ family cysteine cluster protein [Chitinophagales bacterium]|nr:YkgJ family cysteine cluster protein [Chitinophagales bacterium]